MRKNYRLDAQQKADAREAFQILEGSGISLAEAARIALHLEGGNTWERTSIDSAVDAFLSNCRDRVKDGAMRIRTAEYYEENLFAFAAAFPDKDVDDLTRKSLEGYFSTLPVSPTSRATRFRAVRAC